MSIRLKLAVRRAGPEALESGRVDAANAGGDGSVGLSGVVLIGLIGSSLAVDEVKSGLARPWVPDVQGL